MGGGGSGRGWGVRLGGQGEWRSEAFMKIQKKIFFFFWGGGGLGQGGVWLGGQGGWEQRSEACVKIQKKKSKKKNWGGGGWVGWGGGGGVRVGGVRVDVNGEVVKLL